MTVNIEMLRKAVQFVETEDAKPRSQSLWDQELWYGETECGTTMCVAGFVVEQTLRPGERIVGSLIYSSDNTLMSYVADRAQMELGLDTHEADSLFYSLNDANDIRMFAEELAGEKL